MAQSDWYQDEYGNWRQLSHQQWPQQQWQQQQWSQQQWPQQWQETQNFDQNNQNSQATQVLEEQEEEEEEEAEEQEEEEEIFYLLSHAARDPKAFFFTNRQIYHVLENGNRLQTGRYRRRDKVLFPVLSTFCGDDSYGYDIPKHMVNNVDNHQTRVPNMVFTRREETSDYEGIYKCWHNTPDRMYDLPPGPINLQQIIKFLDANHDHYNLTIIGCRGNQNDPYVRFKTEWEPNMIQAKSKESFNRDCLYLGQCTTVYGGTKSNSNKTLKSRLKSTINRLSKKLVQKKNTRRLNAVA